MNLTNSTPNNSNVWQRVKLQHVTLVAGLTLAFGALSLGGWRSATTAVPKAEAVPHQQAWAQNLRSLPVTQWVYYIVSSRDQEELVHAMEAEAPLMLTAAMPDAGLRSYHVRMVTTREEERAIYDFLSEVSFSVGENPVLTIVDLR